MSIQISSVGSTQYEQVPCTSTQDFINAVKNQLISAGWSATADFHNTALFSVNPSSQVTNGQQLRFGGGTVTYSGIITYTFVTTINNLVANQVLVGATAADSAYNLVQAINLGTGSGTLYSSPTAASGFITASLVTGSQMLITSVATGTSALPIIVTSSDNNRYTWQDIVYGNYGDGGSYYYLAGAGCQVTSAPTPQGLKISLLIDNGVGAVRFRITSPQLEQISASHASWWDGTNGLPRAVTGTGMIQVYGYSSRLYEFICNAHQFWLWLLGSDGKSNFQQVMGGVPYVRPLNAPIVVTGATNATPVVISTATAHGRVTGDNVFVCDIYGNADANGFWTNVTVVDSTHIQLNGSSGSGAYSSGGLLAGDGQLARCAWFQGDSFAEGGTFRYSGSSAINYYTTAPYQYQVHFINQAMTNPNGNGASIQSLALTAAPAPYQGNDRLGRSASYLTVFGGYPVLIDTQLCLPLSSSSGVLPVVVGQLWDSFITMENVPVDKEVSSFLGKRWLQFTNSQTGLIISLWIAKT
jgi:hypothetical protein